MKSILDLGVEELEQILRDNALPANVSLQGIDGRKDFEKLFKHRLQPKYIAQTLLQEKLKTRVMVETPDMKSERLAIKQAELELKKLKLETQTQQQTNVYKRLQAIEDACMLVIRGVSNINERLDKLVEEKNKIKK